MSFTPSILLAPKVDPLSPTLMPDRPNPTILNKKLDAAATGKDILKTVVTSGVAPELTDEQAKLLADTPESNDAELKGNEIVALRKIEKDLTGSEGFTLLEPDIKLLDPSIPDIADLAKHLSAPEINSAEFASLARQANEMIKLINEHGPVKADGAVTWLKNLEASLAVGAALTDAFVIPRLNVSIDIIASGGAMVAAQMQFYGYYDPTDPNSSRQQNDVMTTTDSRQDTE